MNLNPLKPIDHLVKAITMPFQALFVVGLCFLINMWTASHHQWWHWVALGMGIAVLCAWARAIKSLIGAAVVAGLGYVAYRWYRRRQARGLHAG